LIRRSKAVTTIIEKYNVWLSPHPNFRDSGPQIDVPDTVGAYLELTNICGYPALALQHGFAATGQPIRLVFGGRLYNETGVLGLAKAYQDNTNWHQQHPQDFV